MLSEIRDRKTNTIWYHLYANLKTKINEQQEQTHGEQTDGCQAGGGLGVGRVPGRGHSSYKGRKPTDHSGEL